MHNKIYSLQNEKQSVMKKFIKVFVSNTDFDTKWNQEAHYFFILNMNSKKLILAGAGWNDDKKTLKAIGCSGRVFFGVDPETGKEIAVKVTKRSPHQTRDVLKKEGQFLLQMYGSKYVSGASEVGFQGDFMFAVMDKVNGEDLLTKSLDKDNPLTTKNKISILLDVAKGVEELHDKGIIHRDLKPGNILVDLTDPVIPKIKLIDLGISKSIKESTTKSSGTKHCMAPEVFRQEVQGPGTDVYALGILIHFLFSNHVLGYSDKGHASRLKDLIVPVHHYSDYSLDIKFYDQLRSLIEGCLKRKPKMRIPITDLIYKLESILTEIDHPMPTNKKINSQKL